MGTASGSHTPEYDQLPLAARTLAEEMYYVQFLRELPPDATEHGTKEAYFQWLHNQNNKNKPPGTDVDYLRENLAKSLARQTMDSQLMTLKGMQARAIAEVTGNSSNASLHKILEQGPGQTGRGQVKS